MTSPFQIRRALKCLGNVVIVAAAAKHLAHVHFGVLMQTGTQPTFGGEPHAIAGVTKMLAHRGDEAYSRPTAAAHPTTRRVGGTLSSRPPCSPPFKRGDAVTPL